MKSDRIAVLAVLSVFTIALAGFSIFLMQAPQDIEQTAAIGGPFHLVDDRGRAVTDADLRGKPSLVYFGYTYCPEICPTTLNDMAGWIRGLGADASKFNFVFVTIDPERDTQKVMHAYVSSFDPRIRGFTGSLKQVATAANAYRVYFKRVPEPGGSYSMDHSTSVYVMDAKGHYFDHIAYQEDEKSVLQKLHAVLSAG